MNYYQSCAAKGNYGNRQRGLFYRSMERAAVNIYRTDSSLEILVFAPGRIREHFSLAIKGNELEVSYTPPEGFARPEWIRREYSRGGFIRTFALDPSIDVSGITAKYVDGVLQVSLPLATGKEAAPHTIPVS
ncbi:Hsp20/alpha crystallin family protein [Chitinophaga solisilvae]|uniref:Hsp20/alpha crystallin family protein n=1 Tax=Chitinophaga solisilvae TaxID=1233460 RepID=UPI00136DCD95|nr:Hsp20/alpha crystallin family protein [Chitinophaga solisilvae]